jgi:hypothetical protein
LSQEITVAIKKTKIENNRVRLLFMPADFRCVKPERKNVTTGLKKI